MMLQNVFLPLFFPGWPLSNVAAIWCGEHFRRINHRMAKGTYLLGVHQVPRQHTSLEALDHVGAGRVCLGPPGAQDTDGLCIVERWRGLPKRPLIQLDGVEIGHSILVPGQGVDGEHDCGFLRHRVQLGLCADPYRLCLESAVDLEFQMRRGFAGGQPHSKGPSWP